jgi:hypothetical protein
MLRMPAKGRTPRITSLISDLGIWHLARRELRRLWVKSPLPGNPHCDGKICNGR